MLWAELRRDARTPLLMRLLLGCVRVRTATVPRAAISLVVRASPLVIYNHGLISFTAENTSLTEELATLRGRGSRASEDVHSFHDCSDD
jgi:hypothetical protein